MAQITQLDDTILGLIPLQPRKPYTESIEWFTDITPFYDGGEEPNSMRNLPRHSFVSEFVAQPDQARDIFNTIYGGLVRQWAIPLWAQALSVGTIIDESDELSVDTTYSDYREDTPVFITDGCGNWQYAYITAMTAASLTLDRNLNAMRRAFVMPMRIGRIKGTPQKRTSGYNPVYSVEFEVDDNIEYDPAAPTQYYANDIYFDYNLLSEGGQTSQNFVSNRETFDEQLGVVKEFTPWLNNRITQPYRVLKETQADAWQLRMFLHRRRGKWRPFWLPTFEADIRLLSTGALTTVIQVELDSMLPWAEVRKNIAVKKTDGSWLARRILNATVPLPGIAELTLDASLATNASSIEFISWLGLKRLDTDRVSLQYIGNNHCESTFNVCEIAP